MPTDVTMPKLGLTMDEGTIVRWLVAQGDRVEQGQPLLEVETDKVTVEVEAPASGVLGAPWVDQGQKVPIGDLLAQIYAEGETPHPPPLGKYLSENPAEAAPRAASFRIGSKPGTATPLPASPDWASTSAGDQRREGVVKRSFSSPRARTQARARGLDWRALPGSGPRGRIIERDVLAAAAMPQGADASVRVPVAQTAQTVGTSVQGPGQTASSIAPGFAASAASAPHLYLTAEALAGALIAVRDRLMETIHQRVGVQLTVTDLLVRIAGAALARYPGANATGRDGRIAVDVGLALVTGAGLVAPVIRGVEARSLAQIVAERSRLVEAARVGRLSPEDLAGAAFTLIDLGNSRVDTLAGALAPRETAALAVGRITERPVAANGQLAIRPATTLTLTCDPRVLDGASAVAFLGRIVELIEEPYLLLA